MSRRELTLWVALGVVGVGLLLALTSFAYAQGGQATSGQVTYPPLLFRDEGVDQGRASRAVNCTGAGITCTVSAGVVTVNAAGGSGSANVVEVSVAMTSGSGYYTATVTGQAWVTASSVIVCQPFGTTADGLTVEQVAVAGLLVTASNRVVSTGFNVNIYNPSGSYGTHRIHCTGA